MRDIAAQSGQNVAAIAYYFGSKDQLYLAAVEFIAGEIKTRLGGVADETQARLKEGTLDKDSAVQLLKRFCRAVFEQILQRPDALPIARMIVREQTQPSPAFDVLYQRAFLPMHQALAILVATATGGRPEDPETIVRTHTIMGQIFFFVMTREAILRRLNWKDFQVDNAEIIDRIVKDNIDTLLKRNK